MCKTIGQEKVLNALEQIMILCWIVSGLLCLLVSAAIALLLGVEAVRQKRDFCRIVDLSCSKINK